MKIIFVKKRSKLLNSSVLTYKCEAPINAWVHRFAFQCALDDRRADSQPCMTKSGVQISHPKLQRFALSFLWFLKPSILKACLDGHPTMAHPLNPSGWSSRGPALWIAARSTVPKPKSSCGPSWQSLQRNIFKGRISHRSLSKNINRSIYVYIYVYALYKRIFRYSHSCACNDNHPAIQLTKLSINDIHLSNPDVEKWLKADSSRLGTPFQYQKITPQHNHYSNSADIHRHTLQLILTTGVSTRM